MQNFSLFELFLVIFSIYAILAYGGSTVPILCLLTVFLFEKLHQRQQSVNRTEVNISKIRAYFNKMLSKWKTA